MRETNSVTPEPLVHPPQLALGAELRSSALLLGLALTVIGGMPLLAMLLTRWG